jgi:hypothetical protein
MKHLTYSEKSLLVSDEAADLVLEYASALSNRGASDTVNITAYGADGDEVVATLLLGQGAPLMAESVTTGMSEPDNSDTVEYIRAALAGFASPPQAQPDTDYRHHHAEDDYQLG